MLYLYHRKIQRKRTNLHNYKLCELVKVSYSRSDYFVRFLLSNLIKSWCESPFGRVTIITPKLDRTRLCFRMKVRFSGALLVSHRIMQRQRMQKYMLYLLLARMVWSLRLVSSFWLSSVHFCLAMQFICKFIWINLGWNGPTWQAIIFILRH